MTVLKVQELCKEFAGVKAVDGLTFEVPRGRVFGLLGPNGSGKTTTIRMCLGILPADGGRVEVLGSPDPLAVRERVGYLPEERGLYAKMKVGEQLAFLGAIRGLDWPTAERRSREWLERLGLAERAESLTNELSKGMQQKVQLAAALIHEPELVVLDEPFSGLDPINTRLFKEILLEEKRRGVTFVLSTHRMEEVEAMCEEICLIHRGRSVLKGSLSEIKASYGKASVALEYEGSGDPFQDLPGVISVQDSGRIARLKLAPGADSQAILKRLVDRVRILAFRLEAPHIEEIYLEKVGAAPAAVGAVTADAAEEVRP
ncbi:MAG: ABC transporter ATP-binding protein [Acidobacteriota bacterium]